MDEAPKYVYIYNQIKKNIIAGVYPINSFLPAESTLMNDYGVSRTTIRKAVKLLKEDNLVKVTQGRGTQVVSTKKQNDSYVFSSYKGPTNVRIAFIDGHKQAISSQAATIDRIDASPFIAGALRLENGTPVYRVQRIKATAEGPFSHVCSYLPCKIFPNLDKYSGQVFFLYSFLEKTYHVVLKSSKTLISATSANFIEAQLLDVPVDKPLLILKRTAYNANSPLEYSESFCRPDIIATEVNITEFTDKENSFLKDTF